MIKIKTASVDSMVIYFSDKISKETLNVVAKNYKILKALKHPHIISIIPSYTSIYVRYDIFKFDEKSIKEFILSTLKNSQALKTQHTKLITIPVFYDISVGYDLERVAELNSINIEDVIALHSKREYFVYTIGFLPGFAYLGTVEEKIATKRLEHPRDLIPKGSVAIADTQTAVYPKDSPGGWNIIGRTSLEMIDSEFNTIVQMGDIVKFEPISKDEFLKNGGKI